MKTSFAYMACALVWGTTWFAIRVCIGDGGFSTFQAAALRFTIATGTLWCIVIFSGRLKRLSMSHVVSAAQAGAVNGLSYALVYKGEETINGGIAAIVFSTLPIFTALVSFVFKLEPLKKHQLLGAGLGVVGVMCIFYNQFTFSRGHGIGTLLLFAAVLGSALYTVLLKKSAKDQDVITTVALFCGFSSCTLWILTFANGDSLHFNQDLRPWMALFYLAIMGSVVTFLCYVYLLKRVSLMVSSTLVFIQPVIAMTVDLLWEESHSLDNAFFVGVSIIALAIAVSLLPKTKNKRIKRFTKGPTP